MRICKPLVLLLVSLALLQAPALLSAQGADEQFSFAQKLQQDRLFEAAGQQYLRFAIDHPSDERAPFALENAAECLVEINMLDEATRVLTTLIETYPDDPRICKHKIRLAKLYQQMKNFEEANRVYTEVISINQDCPQITEAVLGRGETLLALRRYKEAKEVLTSLVRDYNDAKTAPKAYFGLAMATAGLGDARGALDAYMQLGSQYPKNPLSAFAFLEAARLHLETGDSLAAVDAYTRAKGFTERAIFMPACMEGAQLLEHLGKHREALSWYKEVLAREDCDDPVPVYERAARAAYDAGDYQEVKKIAALFGQKKELGFSPEVLYYQARAELKLSEFDAALADAKTLETRAPDSERAAYAPLVKGEALLAAGRSREAISEFRRFVSAVSDSAMRVRTLSRVADIYMSQLADTAKAFDALQEKLEAEKHRNPIDYLAVARLYERAGRYGEARRLYEDIVATFPFSDEETAAQKRLDYIDAFVVLDPSAALKAMEDAARSILNMPQPEGMVLLAQTRIDMLKDFTGALPLAEQAITAAGGDDIRAHALFVKGLCYAGLTRKALALGDSAGARGEYANTERAWAALIGGYASSEWSARAAYETLFLKAAVTGTADSLGLQRTIARYPNRNERAVAFSLLGDLYGTVANGLTAQIAYYKKALLVPDGLGDPAQVRLRLADALYRNGEFDESLVLSRAALEDQRRSIHLRAAYQTAVSLRQLKRYGEAFPFFMEIAQSETTGDFGARALLQAADCLYMTGEFERALEQYNAALQRATNNRFAWEATFRVALCVDKMGEPEEALHLLENCMDSREGGSMRPRAYEEALRIARSLGDVSREGAFLERRAAESRGTEQQRAAEKDLFHWYLKNGHSDKALALSQAMVSSSSGAGLVEAQAFQTMALYRAGRVEEARALNDIVRQGSPKPALLWEIGLQESWSSYEKKNFQQTITTAQPLADNCPGDAPCDVAQFLVVMSLFGTNNVQQAGERAGLFFNAYPLSEYAPLVHLKFGNALAARNQYAEAIGHYQEAAATARDSSTVLDAMKNLGIAYQKMSKWTDAASVWSELIERLPASSYAGEAAINIGRCRMEAGDLPNAVKAYHDALPRLDSEGKARAYYWAGECYQGMRDYKSAIAEYLKVPYLVASEALWGVTAQLKAAECYMSIERFDAAKQIYQQIVRKYGATSDWGKSAAAALKQLESGGAPAEQPQGAQPEGTQQKDTQQKDTQQKDTQQQGTQSKGTE